MVFASKKIILIFFVFVVCIGCDQTSKTIARSILPELDSRSYLNDTVRLQLTYNHGGFLGLGASLAKPLRKGIFTIGVGFLLLGFLVYAFFMKPGYSLKVFAVTLIFSGGLSNLFDRLFFDGSVVDFINIGIGPVRTGIFNVADIAITGGALILFSMAFRRDQQKEC